MKTNVRRSALKGRKMRGFRRKMKTKDGRKITNRQRNRATGAKKHNRSRRGKDRARTLRATGRS
jgi:ribosomal protein L34